MKGTQPLTSSILVIEEENHSINIQVDDWFFPAEEN